MKRIIKSFLLLILVLLAISANADSLKVDRFEERPVDISARSANVRDGNQELCALVRVALPVEGCKFEGNVVKTDFDVNEYLVYLTPGTKLLRIKCPHMSALDINFNEASNANIQALKSGVTYGLDLSGYEDLIAPVAQNKADAGGNYLILDITPKNGIYVKVDDIPQSVEDGQAMPFLKYGQHTYDIEAEGYAPEKGTVTIGKGDKTKVRVALRSIRATFSISPETPETSISINDKNVGKGSYTGQLNPGIYRIEVAKEGYRPYTETIELGASETKWLNVSALTPIYGGLNVGYKPIDAQVAIDGKNVGSTPGIFNDLLVGSHKVTISKPGYDTYTTTVKITEGEVATLNGTLTEKKTSRPTSTSSSYASNSSNSSSHSNNSSAAINTGDMVPSVSGKRNGHDYVDLGLPSGTLWATCDLGASSPFYCGPEYGWGNINESKKEGHTLEDIEKRYKANEKQANSIIKKGIYNISGDPKYDAATAQWGGSWHIPTEKEIVELIKNCKIRSDGEKGYWLIGPNGNKIYFKSVYSHTNKVHRVGANCLYDVYTNYKGEKDKRHKDSFISIEIEDGKGGTEFIDYISHIKFAWPIRPVISQ